MTTRREFLQRCGASVLATASGAGMACASAGRHRELNILCWEGYNNPVVTRPFMAEFQAKLVAEELNADPIAVTRLRAGETRKWDLINLKNPWARTILFPESLIRPLPKDRFMPMFDSMLSRFKGPYHWAMDRSRSELLGMVQRFGPFSFTVNTDRISRKTAEDEGWNLFLDRALKGRIAILGYLTWNVAHLSLLAGLNPYVAHTPEELVKFENTTRQLVQGTALYSESMDEISKAMVDGTIDACFTGGTYSVARARYDGHRNIRGITPSRGPVDGKGAIMWAEITSSVNNPTPSPLAEEFLAYVQRPDIAKIVASAANIYTPVSNMGNPKVLATFNARELDAMQWDTLEEDLDRCSDYNINPDLIEMQDIYLNLKRENERH
ncbi:MAG: PotD/PotF family extracellular solute-binding protein [Hyphomicrobiaceae bacterium]